MSPSRLSSLLWLASLVSIVLVLPTQAVLMHPSDVLALQSVAQEMSPLLFSGTTGAWTESNLRGSCDTPHLATGIIACNDTGYVTHVDLSTLRRAGKLAIGFSDLPALRSLLLTSTASGTLPPEYASLSNLESLHIAGNSVSGGFPESWSRLGALKDLYIQFSLTDSPVPEPPAWLSNLHSIQLFNLNWSPYSFPSSIATSTSLNLVYFSNVLLSGSFPSAFLNNAAIHSFALLDSPRFGSGADLPLDWSGMRNLTSLNLRNLDFEGVLPTSYPPKLTSLLLSELEYIEGTIPQTLLDLPTLEVLVIDFLPNLLGDVSAPSNASLSSLSQLSISNSGLDGTISPRLFSSSSLHQLTLSNLNLLGSIPEPVSSDKSAGDASLACSLVYIEIQQTPGIQGEFPEGILERCPFLNELTLEHLGLSGTLPSTLGNHTVSNTFYKLSLIGNSLLTGEIPFIRFSGASNVLLLSNCAFTGTIPIGILSYHYVSFMVNGNHLDLCDNAKEVALTPFRNNSNSMGACIMQGQYPQECGCPGLWPSRCFPGRPIAPICSRVSPASPPSHHGLIIPSQAAPLMPSFNFNFLVCAMTLLVFVLL